MLQDMLRSYVIDFGGHWYQFLLLCEFSCNNSYYSSIGMTPFEAFCGRGVGHLLRAKISCENSTRM